MTGRSGRGTARQTIRIDESLWERFEAARVAAGAKDRSEVIRDFIRWYTHDKAAKMPRRPVASPVEPPAE